MPSVYDQAHQWAVENFDRLTGQQYESEFLVAECKRLLQDYPGIGDKKWLFIYSPNSATSFFEVADNLPRLMVASAKLQSVASGGGMLVGADFSRRWGTPQCVGEFTPLIVASRYE